MVGQEGKRRAAEGIKGRQLRLVSPWEVSIGCPALITSLAGWKLVKQVLAMAIKLLKTFLGKYVERCGEVVEIHTNVGEFVEYNLFGVRWDTQNHQKPLTACTADVILKNFDNQLTNVPPSMSHDLCF